MIDWSKPIEARLRQLGENPWGYQRYLPGGPAKVSAELAEQRQRDELGWTGQGWDVPPNALHALEAHRLDIEIRDPQREFNYWQETQQRAAERAEAAQDRWDQVPVVKKWLGRDKHERDEVEVAQLVLDRMTREVEQAQQRLDELDAQRSALPEMDPSERARALAMGYWHGASPQAVTETAAQMRSTLSDLWYEGALPEADYKRHLSLWKHASEQVVVDQPPLAEQRNRELAELTARHQEALALAPVLEQARALRQEFLALMDRENTPSPQYMAGLTEHEGFTDVDPAVMDRAADRVVEFVTAHPEIHHLQEWATWVREPQTVAVGAADLEADSAGRERGPYEALLERAETVEPGETVELDHDEHGLEP
ncbi:hypothetical protein [Pseudonocardia sp. NPDC049635]|uniref:hypothetical protein n=1 Tax=Pseudonocardia sp. NPDC049635 TaxID=3155506 RepID=UPI0033CFB70B